MDTKRCTCCEQVKPITAFSTKPVSGKKYYQGQCQVCRNAKRIRKPYDPDKARQYRAATNRRRREDRERGRNLSTIIFEDCRDSDRKKGRPNDLDKPFIESLISQPCSYCGETELRMTLDRVCNFGGHTKDNVVPACYRCNHTRRDMPYEAWLYLIEGMKAARQNGVFGDWASKPISRK